MRRREFTALIGGASLAWPLGARGQGGGRMRRIGVLIGQTESDPEGQERVRAFSEALESLGWIEGRNLRSEYRWFGGDTSHFEHALELVRLGPDVLMVNGTPSLTAAQRATKDIPIVFAQVSDPVGGGFVGSVTHPGGNITGFTDYEYSFAAKWLELLRRDCAQHHACGRRS